MASYDHAKPWKGISVDNLRKVWYIDMESSQKTLNMTTQRVVRTDNSILTSNFVTGGRMIRYKFIQFFFNGSFICNEEIWKTIARSHMLPTICY